MPSWDAAEAMVVVGVDGAGRTYTLNHDIVGRATVVVDPADGVDHVTAALRHASGTGALVLVDDAHRFTPAALTVLASAARRGAPIRLSRRPTIVTAELADLDAAAAAAGAVVEVRPLAESEVGALLARTAGRPVDTDRVTRVHRATGGLPALVVALAHEGVDAPLRARVSRQLAGLGPDATAVVTLLAVSGPLPDDLLAGALGLSRPTLVRLVRALREAGLFDRDGLLLGAIADSVDSALAPAERRELRNRLAGALPATADPLFAARQLRAAGTHSATAAAAFTAAGEQLRFRDPIAATEWYELALATGAPAWTVAAGIAETALLTGRPAPAEVPVPLGYTEVGARPGYPAPGQLGQGSDAGFEARLAIAAGVAAAHQGRARRAADALLAAPYPGPLLAVPSLMATGRADEAKAAAGSPGPVVARLLAEGSLQLADPEHALPALIEAAEAYEADQWLLLPDTPHAVAATAAAAAGDHATAVHLLDRAVSGGVGGPQATVRHRLLGAWVRLRAGDPEAARTALARIAQGAQTVLPGRERTLIAALSAGLARRSGEVSRLREIWPDARPALVRRSVDLLVAESVEETLVASARLGEPHLAEATLADLDAMVAGLNDPPAWTLLLQWARLHTAVALDDAELARAAAAAMASVPARGPRQLALRAAAAAWGAALAGSVDEPATLAAAGELAATGLRWEASRLCGHAGIRTTDATAARRLLERARELGDAGRGASGSPSGGTAGLTDREVEIARLVLAGQTHKAIGSQLFLSPKTVEHHVARIRGKLGATNRAELIAALQSLAL